MDKQNVAPKHFPNCCKTLFVCQNCSSDIDYTINSDASFLLAIEVLLLTVRLFYLRWGRK